MAFELKLADLAEGMVEGEIIRWLVKEGDKVKEDQLLVEIMTDKATVEIPSPRAGTIAKLCFTAGDVAKVGAVLVEIDVGGDQKQATGDRQQATGNVGAVAAASKPTNGHANGGHATTPVAFAPASGKILATPATRKLARDLGVDLATVSATGDSGRVTKDDVQRAKSGGGMSQAKTTYTPLSISRDVSDERVPFRGVRKKIAENMHRSKSTAAHFTYVEECDVTELANVRKRAKSRAEERGIKLSFLPFIVKAVCAGLKKYPIVNATLDESAQEIVLRKRYHVGVAAASEAGLIVPVVKDADQKSLFQIASELEQLSEKAKTGKASRDDLTGSTFTISSLGTLGGVLATPIINFPEVAILGVHKIKQTPVVRDGQIVIRDMMNLSISLDHRVVDGYEGALFLQHVVELLQDPTLMFMEMV